MNLLKTTLAYFGGVFSLGFILGVMRVALVVEHLGERWAELLELPLMIAVSYLVARVCIRQFGPFTDAQRLLIGGLALLLMIAAELGLGMAMGQDLIEYFAGRDPVSGIGYLISLILFGLMPWFAGRIRETGAATRPGYRQ